MFVTQSQMDNSPNMVVLGINLKSNFTAEQIDLPQEICIQLSKPSMKLQISHSNAAKIAFHPRIIANTRF